MIKSDVLFAAQNEDAFVFDWKIYIVRGIFYMRWWEKE